MTIAVDVAGAFFGGAARFLRELDGYLATTAHDDVRVIGRGRHLDPTWLVLREFICRSTNLRISLNNASFVGLGGRNIVLLRNALHFASATELADIGYRLPRSVRAQIPVIRTNAKRADLIVVPCSSMANRVRTYIPSVDKRLVVRPHPVSPPPWTGKPPSDSPNILVPVVPAPYKNLEFHITQLITVTESMGAPGLVLTATPDQLPSLANNPRLQFIGLQTAEALDRHWQQAHAIYYPTGIESFGYPLAEARAGGRNIIAQDTEQNHEIADEALCGFVVGDLESLESAARLALSTPVTPNPDAFSPVHYFDWLLEGLIDH